MFTFLYEVRTELNFINNIRLIQIKLIRSDQKKFLNESGTDCGKNGYEIPFEYVIKHGRAC